MNISDLNGIQGLLFDMDNTLLQSHIDFKGMKQAIWDLLVENKVPVEELDLSRMTASQLIEAARMTPSLNPQLEKEIWAAVTHFEKAGMQDVKLESGSAEMLQTLKGQLRLTLLTNNAREAAILALEETGILQHFDVVSGREQMQALKPSPSGVLAILAQYPEIPAKNWLFIGDSWIDGAAAAGADVKFIAYRGNLEDMRDHAIEPLACITDIRELPQLLGYGILNNP